MLDTYDTSFLGENIGSRIELRRIADRLGMEWEDVVKRFPKVLVNDGPDQFDDDKEHLIRDWCEENCEGEVASTERCRIFAFSNEDDMVPFKMMWS